MHILNATYTHVLSLKCTLFVGDDCQFLVLLSPVICLNHSTSCIIVLKVLRLS